MEGRSERGVGGREGPIVRDLLLGLEFGVRLRGSAGGEGV